MPDHLGEDMRKVKVEDKEKEEAEIKGKSYKKHFCQVIGSSRSHCSIRRSR